MLGSMPIIPLEDSFTDIISKAQEGRRMPDERLANLAGVSLEDLQAVKAGKPLVAVVRRISRHLHLNPNAMEDLVRKAWYPKQPALPRGFAMFNTPYGDNLTVNSYLVWDSRTKEAAVFDTGTDCTDMLGVIKAENLRVQFILLTHTHRDHVADLAKLAAETRAGVWSSELEPMDFPGARTFKQNAYFHAGTISIKALLTCGHSPGLTSYFITGLSWPLAIVGDSLFAGSMGGTEDRFEEQHRNNYEKIFSLPKDTILAFGHGPMSSLAEEKDHNPFFAR